MISTIDYLKKSSWERFVYHVWDDVFHSLKISEKDLFGKNNDNDRMVKNSSSL